MATLTLGTCTGLTAGDIFQWQHVPYLGYWAHGRGHVCMTTINLDTVLIAGDMSVWQQLP